MPLFRADEPTLEQSMALLNEINTVIDTLHEAGLEATPGAVQDVLAAKGTSTTVTVDDGTFTFQTTDS